MPRGAEDAGPRYRYWRSDGAEDSTRYDASMFPKEYKIILADSTAKLEEKVNAAMADGWHLIGGVAIKSVTEPALFLQAVAK